MTSPRSAILSRLRANQEVDEWADLCIYPSGSLYVVEFLPPTGAFDPSGLTDEQADQLRDEGELSEYFDTPEEAADLYLLLEERCQGRLLPKKAAFADEGEAPRKPRAAKKVALPALDAEGLQQEVSQTEVPVAVLFWSPWSGPDRMALPAVNAVAATTPGVKFFTFDVEQAPEIVTGLKLQQTPALVVFRDGKLHAQVEGALTDEAMRRALA